MKKHTVFSSYPMSFEFAKEQYHDYYGEYPENDNMLEDFIQDSIETNFNLIFDELKQLRTQGRIVVIANLGLWYGRVKGYKILTDNLSSVFDAFKDCDYIELWIENNKLLAKGSHHDGTNYIEFREINEDRDYMRLLDDIYCNKPITNRTLGYYTKPLGKFIKKYLYE